MRCPRCNGFVLSVIDEDDDPTCAACGRRYPQPKALKPTRRTRESLRDTVRYTGPLAHLNKKVCKILFKSHPSPSIPYPLMEVTCPWCEEQTTVDSADTNPAAYLNFRKKRKYKQLVFEAGPAEEHKGVNYVRCKSGHMYKLKLSGEGIYSWE